MRLSYGNRPPDIRTLEKGPLEIHFKEIYFEGYDVAFFPKRVNGQ